MKTPFNFLLTALLIAPLLIPHHSVHAQPEAADHLIVLLIIDNSGSMRTSDPANLRYTAARLFIALLEEGDSVGLITFATQSQWMTEGIVPVTSNADKHTLIDQLEVPQADGYTDVRAAFTDSAKALELYSAASQPTIIFLTDGDPEIPTPYEEYESETLTLIEDLQVPVYSIALTNAAQTPFLHQVSTRTSGVVIPAQSAADLLDAYLQIFGQIKDRTVSGEGVTAVPGNANFTIDPALAPFVENASFIIANQSVSPNIHANLIDPTGQVITGNTPGVDFTVTGDPGFLLLTVNRPAGGEWSFQMQGSGIVQARLVLHSRLRIQVELPGTIHPAGEAFAVRCALLEEQRSGESARVVGHVNFTATITTPDSNQIVLDSLYDDGTHGDAMAEDGEYTRLFIETQSSGVYTISIQGWKGLVPFAARFEIQAMPFPEITIVKPAQTRTSVHQEPVDLAVRVTSPSPEKGDLIAQILQPSGVSITISLTSAGGEYIGSFLPLESGTYSITFSTVDAVYMGVPFTRTATTSIYIEVIPTVTLAAQALDFGVVEAATVEQGLAFTIPVTSTSRLVEVVYPTLADLPNFALQPGTGVGVPPTQPAELSFVLGTNTAVTPGIFQGSLSFSARASLDLVNSSIPVVIEIYQPTIKVMVTTLDLGAVCGCTEWDGTFTLPIETSSRQIEILKVVLSDPQDVYLEESTIQVSPGQSSIQLRLRPLTSPHTGEYQVYLALASRAGLDLQPGMPISIRYKVPSHLVRCQRPIVTIGAITLVVMLLAAWITVRIRSANRPAAITGTLRHWLSGNPTDFTEIDLTALHKPILTIGRNDTCDIHIPDSSLAEVHATLKVNSTGAEARILLQPFAEAQIGYRILKGETPLEHSNIVSLGQRTFQYLSDNPTL